MALSFRIEGFDRLERKLKRLGSPTAKRFFRAAMKKAATTIVLPAARRNVPFDTGRLFGGLEIKPIKRSRKRTGVVVQPKSRAEMGIPASSKGYYPTHVEWGTKNSDGTPRVKAQPYLRPAVEDNRTQAIRVVTAEVELAIFRIMRKGR